MREKQIEQKLVKAVRNAGGLCPKFVSPGLAGMPDRLILLPGRRLAFVEVKAPGEKPRLLQLHRHAQLRALGFRVHVLDDPAQIPEILEQAQAPVAQAPVAPALGVGCLCRSGSNEPGGSYEPGLTDPLRPV